jgi:dipeptidyl-peptidase-4
MIHPTGNHRTGERAVPTDRRPWQLTIDRVVAYPRPATAAPARLAFSPDGKLLTYLWSEDESLVRALWATDTQTGERRVLARAPGEGTTDATANPAEALRRERERLREGGITHYRWARHADRILVPLNGQLYLTSSAGEPLRPLAPADAPATDARLTADGERVVFVRGGELSVVDVAGGDPRRLTFDATDTVTNGLAEYIAQEEMGRAEGFWIAPDGARVAYAQVDEADVCRYPIVHQGGDQWQVEEHRYPFAGTANARVRLGVLPLAGGATTWLDLGPAADAYLARVDWRPDGRLVVQVEARDQQRLDLRAYDVDARTYETLLVEEQEPWINLHDDLRFVGDDPRFVWSSERTGYRHLYLYAGDGTLLRPLTAGEWPVDSLVHVDAARDCAYFLAGRESPLERHLYRVALDGGAPVRLTDEPGFHGATFAHDGSLYAHAHENRTTPPHLRLRRADGTLSWTVYEPHLADDVRAALPAPELVEVAAHDSTRLYGALYRPQSAPDAPAPTIVEVYGGPHAQTVTDTWGQTVDLRAQYLAAQGYAVFKLDNRGAARRGLAFEGVLHRRTGAIEVQDQVDGVRWLAARGVANPARVGIYGWSYGGYLTLMCLLTAPEVFRVGVAGAPVTHWDGYDTHYTERYMDTPADNPAGYAASAALTHAAGLAGRLLVVHGMIDENVHFRHTARLIAALQTAERPFDLLVLPADRHLPRDEAGRRYLEARLVEYFAAHL